MKILIIMPTSYKSKGLYCAGSVPGQSSVNFIYNLMEVHEGPHGRYTLKESRPLTGTVFSPPEGTENSRKWNWLLDVFSIYVSL